MSKTWESLNREIESIALTAARGLMNDIFPHQEKYPPKEVNDLLMQLKAFVLSNSENMPTYLRRISNCCEALGTTKKFSRERLDAKRQEVTDLAKPFRDRMVAISQGNWALSSEEEWSQEMRALPPTPVRPPLSGVVVTGTQSQQPLPKAVTSSSDGRGPSAKQIQASRESDLKVAGLLQRVLPDLLALDLSPKEKATFIERLGGALGVVHHPPKGSERNQGSQLPASREGPARASKKPQAKSSYSPEIVDLTRELEKLKSQVIARKKQTGKDLPSDDELVVAKRQLTDRIAKLKVSFRKTQGASDSGGNSPRSGVETPEKFEK